MKKIIAVVALVVLVAGFAGCCGDPCVPNPCNPCEPCNAEPVYTPPCCPAPSGTMMWEGGPWGR